MTDLSAGSKLCSNCEQQINLASFLMHETFCLRNMVRCGDCNKPIDKNRQKEHHKEFHEQIKCECGDLVAKSDMTKHRSEKCRKRQIKCDYCELSLDSDKLRSHVDFCGSRTELCTQCGRYIQLKDRDMHEISKCSLPGVPTTSFKTNSNNSASVSLVNERKAGQSSATRQTSGTDRRRRQTSDDFNMLPCEFCYEPYPLEQLIVHQAVCAMNNNNTNNIATTTTTATNTQPTEYIDQVNHRLNAFGFSDNEPTSHLRYQTTQNDDAAMVPCEFCHQLFDFDFIIIHQSECDQVPSTPRVSSSSSSTTTGRQTTERWSASSASRLSTLRQPTTGGPQQHQQHLTSRPSGLSSSKPASAASSSSTRSHRDPFGKS